MDYIIIALWGLLAGGMLWSNTNSPSVNVLAAEVRTETAQLVASGPSASSTKKIQQTTDDKSAKQARKKAKQVAKEAEKQAKKAARQAEKEALRLMTADRPVATGGLLNRMKDKDNEPKHKALSFSGEQPEAQCQDTVVVYALKSDQGIVYTTDAAVANAAIEATKALEAAEQQAAEQAVTAEAVAEEAIAIVEPLFEVEPQPVAAYKRSDLKLPGQMKIEQLLCDEDGEPRQHVLRRGESLTQIAQRYYADSSFWPYIYEVNRHQLSSPDKIQADMKLYLPDPAFYGIDATDQQSVGKAKTLVSKYLR